MFTLRVSEVGSCWLLLILGISLIWTGACDLDSVALNVETSCQPDVEGVEIGLGPHVEEFYTVGPESGRTIVGITYPVLVDVATVAFSHAQEDYVVEVPVASVAPQLSGSYEMEFRISCMGETPTVELTFWRYVQSEGRARRVLIE